MPNLEELLRLVNEASSRTARIKTLTAKMNATHEPESDDYGTKLLSANLEIAVDYLRIVQEMASYSSRPVKETSRLWKNGRGQYETTAGFCFREGSPIEVLVPALKSLYPTNTVRAAPIGSGLICGTTAGTITLPIIPISP